MVNNNFLEITKDMGKYTHKVQRAVYDNIVKATNEAMRDYDPRPSASSRNFYARFKYKGKLGGAFADNIRKGVYVKKRGKAYEIAANMNSAQMAILDSKGWTLRRGTQKKKGLLTHGATKNQSFNFDAAERKVQKARDATQSIINSVQQ